MGRGNTAGLADCETHSLKRFKEKQMSPLLLSTENNPFKITMNSDVHINTIEGNNNLYNMEGS